MNLIYALMIAFAMYSKIPMPRVDWRKERMRYCLCFFPAIGAVIGVLMILWMRFGMYLVGNKSFHTAVLILIPVLVTGGIHLDGFLDTSDALSSYKSVEEKLEILKDSNAGAFAVIMGCCYFVLDFGVYSAVRIEAMEILAVGFVLSRAFSAFAIVNFKKAKTSGLAALFSDMAQKQTITVACVIYAAACALVMLYLSVPMGLAAIGMCGLSFLAYYRMAYRKFGGMTGDLAGFFVQVCELAMAIGVVVTANFM
ncbi:MAG: adenosylcobinamide-GDP ribazoletransferase [Eubacteriales bacterium]|nr:adenosylcobinamide-GDP ribazoletransferase [Eubacteriales bacterium]